MPYGITLADHKKMVPDQIKELYDVLIDSAPLLSILPFENIDEGVDPKIPTISGDSEISFRAFNSSFPAAAVSIGQVEAPLRPFGRPLQYDSVLTAQGLMRKMTSLQRAFAHRMGLFFQDKFINGDLDADANGFDGIKKRCTTATHIMYCGTDGGPITIDLLDQLIRAVSGKANLLITNQQVEGYILTLAKDQGYFERFTRITLAGIEGTCIAFDGVPILPLWENADGDAVIPHDEEVGESGAVCTSIYALKLGMNRVRGVQGRSAPDASYGLNIGALEKIPLTSSLGQTLEWPAGIGVPDDGLIYRLAGITGTTASET